MASSPDCGAAIRAARRARGLTVRELARRLRVSPATISAVENGKTGVSVHRRREYAQALDVAPARLLDDAALSPATGPEVPHGGPDWRTFPPLALNSVLSAAIDAFVETGYHGSTMRDLAARAH